MCVSNEVRTTSGGSDGGSPGGGMTGGTTDAAEGVCGAGDARRLIYHDVQTPFPSEMNVCSSNECYMKANCTKIQVLCLCISS